VGGVSFIQREIIMKTRLLGSMRAYILTLFVSIAVLVVSISHVHASMVTFQFEGELTRVNNELSSEFAVGDTFKGSYTFDTSIGSGTSLPSLSRYPHVITAMSFVSGGYTASATNGDVDLDLEGFNDYDVFFDPVSGQSVENYLPTTMGLSWSPDQSFRLLRGNNTEEVFLPGEPHFDRNLQIHIREPELAFEGAFADADGNIITDFEAYYRDDPNRPVFDGVGGLNGEQIGLDGSFFLSFINEDQSFSGISGELTSVTVVPIPAAVWLFGTGLGLIGFAKRKKIS
jgi:hypothetical protein